MKKRLLCIVITLLMILPLVLVSCGKTDERDKMKDIILGTDSDTPIDRAYTLSLWIPTDAITVKGVTADLSELTQQQKQNLISNNPDVYEFLKRVDDVEDAINEILIGRSYYTKIDIVPVNNEYYEEALANKFASIDAEVDPGDMDILGKDTAYENEIAEEVVGNKVLYDLLYRPVNKNQLDLFLIRDYGEYDGYEQYVSYANAGYLVALNDPQKGNYITTTGDYASITKLIRDPILQQYKLDGKLFALPNNHMYAEEYQYILVNKDILASNENFKIEDMNDFDSCIDFINAVGSKGDKNVVPLVGSFDDVAGYLYLDSDLALGGTVNTDEEGNTILGMENIFASDKFNSFVEKYKELQDKNYVKSDADDDDIVAVRIFNGSSMDVQEYADDYYLIKTAVPVANTEDIFSSMFAISTFSLNYDRSMKMLNLLQSDTQIRTLLQYGINGEDYTIVTEYVDGEEISKIKIKEDTLYRMNSLYTGNQYYTYPGDNTEIDDWDDVKTTNLEMIINPFIKFDYYLANGNLTDAELQFISDNKDKYATLINNVYSQIANMTLSEYKLFLETYNADFDALALELAEKKEKVEALAVIDQSVKDKEKQVNDEEEKMKKDGTYNRYEELKALVDRFYELNAEVMAGIMDNLDEWLILSMDVASYEVELNTIGGTLIKLKGELDELKESQAGAEAEKIKLQGEYDTLNNKIKIMKEDYAIAYKLSNDADYAKLMEIYNKVLESFYN